MFAGGLEDIDAPPKIKQYYAGHSQVTVPKTSKTTSSSPASWFLSTDHKWTAYVQYVLGACVNHTLLLVPD